MSRRHPAPPAFVRKLKDPKHICKKEAEEIGRKFFRISQAPPGDQSHDAKKLHELMTQTLEIFDHWNERIDDKIWLDALWSPIFAIMLRCCDALDAHLEAFPDPEIAATVLAYRKAMADFEQHQTTPGVVEVPFEV